MKINKNTIKFETIKYINGVKYLSPQQRLDVKYLVCSQLNIDKVESNFEIIQIAINNYFEAINSNKLSENINKLENETTN